MASGQFQHDSSGYDDEEKLRLLLAKVDKLHIEFFDKSSTWKSALTPTALNVSEALLEVLRLAKLIPNVCPKNREAYWKHEIEYANASVDEALQKLKTVSHAAYTAIQAKESLLEAEQGSIGKNFESVLDMIDRAQVVEQESDLFIQKMNSLQVNTKRDLEEKRSSHEEAMSSLKRATQDIENGYAKILKKQQVNSNIWSGLEDWFSRSDDQFNLALSLGIGTKEEREKDERTINYLIDGLNTEAEKVQSAKRALNEVNGFLLRLHKARETLESTAECTQSFKTQAKRISEDLAKRKDALQQVATKLSDVENTMQNIDEETKLLSIGQMSAEILTVLSAAAKYQAFESNVEYVNRMIWYVLVDGNDWKASFDEDEELEPLYKEMERLFAQEDAAC